MNLARMMAAVDHQPDRSVDRRQLAEPRDAERVAARREVGVEADLGWSPVRAYRSRTCRPRPAAGLVACRERAVVNRLLPGVRA